MNPQKRILRKFDYRARNRSSMETLIPYAKYVAISRSTFSYFQFSRKYSLSQANENRWIMKKYLRFWFLKLHFAHPILAKSTKPNCTNLNNEVFKLADLTQYATTTPWRRRIRPKVFKIFRAVNSNDGDCQFPGDARIGDETCKRTNVKSEKSYFYVKHFAQDFKLYKEFDDFRRYVNL